MSNREYVYLKDFCEHGIAPREIITTDDFASERKDQLKDKARAVNSLAALIPGDTGLLEELIAPARYSSLSNYIYDLTKM